MIDYIRVYREIQLRPEDFVPELWHERTLPDGTEYLWTARDRVIVRYYRNRNRLMIHGKILRLVCRTDVQNFDDIYGNLTEEFMDEVNDQLNSLFVEPKVDIREFIVTRMDYCFNVDTPYVKEYILALQQAFQSVTAGNRIDFTAVYRKYGSVYIKPAGEFRDNARRNYVLNIYDKYDWVQNKKAEGWPISMVDEMVAMNILRVEVQASYAQIKSICKNLGISRDFRSMFCLPVALWAVNDVFRKVYRSDSRCDFFTYVAARDLVHHQAKKVFKTRLSAEEKLLRSIATKHRATGRQYDYGRKKLAEKGIYPFWLLPKDSPVPLLENPVKLVQRKAAPFLS